ncbi:hypothetical protein Tco_0947442 [Tanacetum coccineum]
MGQSFNGDVNEMQGYLFVNLAKKIKNIDGKVLKKDASRMAVRGVRIDKDKVIASPSLEQVVSPFKLVSFAEQVCITPMKDYQMETDDPPLKSVSIDENNSSDYGTNQLSVHIGDVNGFLILKEADPKVKAFANVVKGANGAANNDNTKKKINIRTLISEDKVENSDFVFFLPIAAFQIVKCLLIHLWFFRGNGICVSLGPIYVSRAWKEFGFQKIMRDDDGFFYFKFESNKGMEQFLNKEVVMAVPIEDGAGHTLERIKLEYEWKPPLCLECHVFGHDSNSFPKKAHEAVKPSSNSGLETKQQDGFTTVTHKKKKTKNQANVQPKQFGGLKLNKPTSTMVWNKKATQPRRVEKGESPNAQNHKDKPATNPSKTYSSAPKADDIVLKNSFSQLVENAEVEWGDDQTWGNAKHAVSTINESDSEEVDEDINLEEPPGQAMSHANKGNSVPHG